MRRSHPAPFPAVSCHLATSNTNSAICILHCAVLTIATYVAKSQKTFQKVTKNISKNEKT